MEKRNHSNCNCVISLSNGTRTLWTYLRSQVWFEMVDDAYNDELWYANFRVTKKTFAFILGKIEQDIDHKNTHFNT